MAQNVTIAGAEYTGVPSINVPKIGGGSAGFYDLSETTATAQDVAAGKLFMSSQGILTTGTSSGGSGGDPVATILVETAVTTTSEMVNLLNEHYSSWELNHVYFASIQGNTATGNYKGLSVTIIKHAQGMYYGFLRPANLTAVINDSYLFDISVGSVITIYESENAIYPDPVKRIAIRPDAEIAQSWTYDKRIVADEGITIPEYQTTTVTLKATEQIGEITADAANYKYLLTFRTLVIPEYNTNNISRGRYEWSSMVGAYDFVFTPMAELHPLVDGTYTIATNSASVQGGASYRSLYFTSSTGISIYATTAYGIWTTAVAPAYVTGKIRVNSPTFTMRAQANIFDQSYYEALTDIRFQYVYELWRVPIDSLDYRGWMNQQSVDFTLDCLYSADHKLL